MADATRRTTFRALVKEIREDVLSRSNLGLSQEKIFLSVKPMGQQTNIKSTKFLVLRPGAATVDGIWHDSEGRLCVAVDRTLIVEPYLQQSLDEVTETNRITDEFMAFEDQIVDAIDIYEPLNSLEPIHFLGISAEEGWQTPGWNTTSLRFSVKFLQAVNQSRQ